MATGGNILEIITQQDSWRMFRIIAETVNGFEELSSKGKCVSIFGSARSTEDDPTYKTTVEIAYKLGQAGYGVITGGGPGLMEAGNRGAKEAGAESIGLHIHLPSEQDVNPFVTTRCDFRYFFIRKFMFVKYAKAYIVMPGGMGTIDELSEAFVLAQTERIRPFPIILYDSSFWGGMLDWLKDVMVKRGYIREQELEPMTVLDSPDEVVRYIRKHVLV
ncbi:TIGR00730 family Rossman fold protein [Desulfovibrio sp. OttesenSCG-928-C14]|nr:TIGR00730 family Rossman fold protein [Desulfovibrio sp. OttesenSCG-928-C14]